MSKRSYKAIGNIIGALMLVGIGIVAGIVVGLYVMRTINSLSQSSTLLSIVYVDAEPVNTAKTVYVFKITCKSNSDKEISINGVTLLYEATTTITDITILSPLSLEIDPYETVNIEVKATFTTPPATGAKVLVQIIYEIDGKDYSVSKVITIS